MLYNPELKGAYNFVPGVMAMVLFTGLYHDDRDNYCQRKRNGHHGSNACFARMKPLMVVIAKAIPYLMLSAINIASILLLSVFVLGVPVNGSLALLAGESILFTLVSLSLGLLISSGAESQQTAMFISLVALFLPTVMLSGFMFPVENMPLPLTNRIKCSSGKMVLYNCKISDDKRDWPSDDLERNIDPYRHDGFLFKSCDQKF